MWRNAGVFETDVAGCIKVLQATLGDERGWFSRVFEAEGDESIPVFKLAHVNNSWSKSAGTLRGLHWQVGDDAESKIVRCVRGSILDLVVDVRAESTTFGHSALIPLSADEPSIAVVPKGCAHGVLTMVDDSEIIYWADRPFAAVSERGLRFDDPFANLALPITPIFVSEKDLSWADFRPYSWQ